MPLNSDVDYKVWCPKSIWPYCKNLYKIAVFLKILTVFVTEFYKSHLTSGSVENAFFLQFSAAKISSLLISFSWNVFILNESRLSCWKRQFLRGSWSFQPSGYIQKQTFWSVKSKHSLTDGSFDLLFASGTHQLHNGLKQFFEGVLGASTFEVVEAEGYQLS